MKFLRFGWRRRDSKVSSTLESHSPKSDVTDSDQREKEDDMFGIVALLGTN